MAVLLQTT